MTFILEFHSFRSIIIIIGAEQVIIGFGFVTIVGTAHSMGEIIIANRVMAKVMERLNNQ